MANGTEAPFRPLVTSATTAQSLNVRSIMDALEARQYAIPEYQRDSSQWDTAKKSLFIESIINNLTIPPLIVYPEDDAESGLEVRQVIDGQQRLTTIREFLDNKFLLSDDNDVDYAENVGPIIKGRGFSSLPSSIQRQIQNYTINLIVLPKNLDLSLRLEVFRRINEGGVPLSAHDLRLATFGESDRIWLIRLAGIFDPDREGSRRMIDAARDKFNLSYPWKDASAWRSWWLEKKQSIGQAPSEMFLYYVIAKDLNNLEKVLDSSKTLQSLGIKYDRTTVSVLDIYCAHMQRESRDSRSAQMLVRLDIMKDWFCRFELWFNRLKMDGMRISLNSSRKIAFFIAAAGDIWGDPNNVTDSQWQRIQVLLTEGPTKIKSEIGMDFAIAKGKWPGQKKQIDRTYELCKEIAHS